MRGAFKSGPTPIGIDVGGRSLNAVQLGRERGCWRVDAACSVPRVDASASISLDEAEHLASVLERQGFRGNRVVVAVPAAQLLTAQLDLQIGDQDASLENLAHAELASVHQGDPARLVSACWQVSSRSDMTRVMAVGCNDGYANGLLDVLEGAGFNVLALDVESLAIARACTGTLGRGLSAVLSIGWRAAQLVVVADGVVAYERTLADAGCVSLYETLQGELDLDDDVADHVLNEIGLSSKNDTDETLHRLTAAARERILAWVNALVPEVRLSLTYAAHESGRVAVDRLSLVGEGACIPGLDAELAQEFGVEATVVSPSDLIGTSTLTDCSSPTLTVAFGLAMHGSR